MSVLATADPVGVPMLRMNNLQDDGWDLSDLKYINLPEPELAKYRIQKGDILFNRTNSKELVGKCEVFREDGDWVFASYLIRVKLNPQKALPDFVSAFLNTDAGRLQIDRVSRQIIGMSNVNAEELKDLEIPLPPLDIQRALVAEMEAARAARLSKLAEAESLLQGMDGFVLAQLGLLLAREKNERKIFAMRFGAVRQRFDVDYHTPYFRNLRTAIQNSAFEVVNLGEILKKPLTSGFAAGRGDQAEDDTVGVPHVRPFNIKPNGEFSLETIKFVPRENISASDWLTKGEVLFNNTNSTEWVGKSTVFEGESECACSNHITRLFLKPEKVEPVFVAALFNALRSIGLFGLLSTNFNNQAGINSETLASLQLPLPPLAMQKSIADELSHRREQARRLRGEAELIWKEAKEQFEQALLG